MTDSKPKKTNQDDRNESIQALAAEFSGLPDGKRRSLIEEMISTCLRLGDDDAHTGELKLLNAALKEMRYGPQ